MNKYALWFRWLVWVGVLQNCLMSIPAIFAPNFLLGLLHQRLSLDPIWASFAALLLTLLSLFYIPGGYDPYRYTANAVLAVFSRAAGVIFFFLISPNIYPTFGIIDLVFFLLQTPVLILALANKGESGITDKTLSRASIQ